MNPPAGPELRDIHLPPPPDWWPPAPGWWLLAFVLVAAAAWILYKIGRIRKVHKFRRTVLKELERCIAAAPQGVELAAALSQFLRRLVLCEEREAVALHGEAWLAYLDRRLGGDEFTRGAGRVLLDAPYRRHAEIDAPALIALVRRWARQALEREARHA